MPLQRGTIFVRCVCGLDETFPREQVSALPNRVHRCENLVTRNGNRERCGFTYTYTEILKNIGEGDTWDIPATDKGKQLPLEP